MTAPRPSMVKVLKHYGADRVPEARGWTPMRCPFHEDKNASASVNAEAFHCHACGISGDAFKIIMEQEGLSFKDAVTRAQEIDQGYEPAQVAPRGKEKTRRWAPPGRRGRQHG